MYSQKGFTMQPFVVNLLQAGPLPGCYQWHFKADEWSSYYGDKQNCDMAHAYTERRELAISLSG